MKMFWQFIVAVVANFVFLVSGSILALYYVFVAPHLPESPLKVVLDVGLPLLCFFIACYMAWRKQQLTIRKLQKAIKEHDNKKPLYHFEVADGLDVIKTHIEEVDDKIRSAKVSKTKAPAPHPFLGRLNFGEPSNDSWQVYIDELVAYKALLQSYIDGDEYHVINFSLENKGYGDTNVSVDLRFNGFVQEVDFYDEKIRYEEPHEPSYMGIAALSNMGVINKLGNRREVQTDEADRIIAEVDRIRHDDRIRLHYNPIFIKKSDGRKKIEYSIKSDRLTNTEVKTVLL